MWFRITEHHLPAKRYLNFLGNCLLELLEHMPFEVR
jgi:hypothetical protein